MSGTSLDGVDIAYIEFIYTEKWDFNLIYGETFRYSNDWLNKLKQAFNYNKNELNLINDKYGKYLAELINKFIDKKNIKKVDFIASHGHTIHHKPDEGYTLQIGNGKTIADITKIKTVYDFRTQDVYLGGQGAPLVPIGDELLFSEYDYCLNLGGFANISFKKGNDRIAYDICAVNTVLNFFSKKLGFDYDNNGEIASKNNINSILLNDLNDLDFYKTSAPKSLGIEYVNDIILPLINNYKISSEDAITTFVEHIAIQISNNISKDGKLLITGGGAFNSYLIERIKFYTNSSVIIPSNNVIDFKEAIVFGFLGLLKLENKVNCLKSVTGASKDHSSGKISQP